jgi:hypothetical protein
MAEYLIPLLLLVVLFVGFGLAHGNGKGAGGCSGCTSCEDKSECQNESAGADAASRH